MPASDVLRNGYGDCKDKHTCFPRCCARRNSKLSLLIGSRPQTGCRRSLPSQFDHVITAARLGPGSELTFLDTTPEVTPFGLILYQLRNKQAVVASEGPEGGLQRTPPIRPSRPSCTSTSTEIHEFGALDATLK